MKKNFVYIFFMLFIFSLLNIFLPGKVLAYSSGFAYMISAVGIDETNINGLAINEDVYSKYNLIVYGSPLGVPASKQRFKATSSGRWTKNGGAYRNSGTRGEYMILGEDASR